MEKKKTKAENEYYNAYGEVLSVIDGIRQDAKDLVNDKDFKLLNFKQKKEELIKLADASISDAIYDIELIKLAYSV